MEDWSAFQTTKATITTSTFQKDMSAMLGKPRRPLFIENFTVIFPPRSVWEGRVGNTWEGWRRTKERNLVHRTLLVHSFLPGKHWKETEESSSQVWERRQFLGFEPLKGWSRRFHRRPLPFSPQSLAHQRLPNPKPATCKKLDLGQERWLSGYATKPEVIPETYLVEKKRIQRIVPWAPLAHCGGTVCRARPAQAGGPEFALGQAERGSWGNECNLSARRAKTRDFHRALWPASLAG